MTISEQDTPTGLVEMTNDQYHSSPGISKSHLDCVAGQSLRHYWAKYIDPERERDSQTPAMKVGQAVHTAILEPHLMDEHIVKGLPHDRRSNANKDAWAAFEKEHAHQIIITADQYEAVRKMRDVVHAHPVAAGLFAGGRAEQTYFARSEVPDEDEDAGVLIDHQTGEVIEQVIKCRCDYVHDGGSLIVDLKKTTDASPIGFGKSAANYRYDVQAAWYFHVWEKCFGWIPDIWAFVAVEESWPHAVGVYFVNRRDLETAHNAAMSDFRRIVKARQSDNWPDYGASPEALKLPAWCRR